MSSVILNFFPNGMSVKMTSILSDRKGNPAEIKHTEKDLN